MGPQAQHLSEIFQPHSKARRQLEHSSAMRSFPYDALSAEISQMEDLR